MEEQPRGRDPYHNVIGQRSGVVQSDDEKWRWQNSELIGKEFGGAKESK
jgi:hypothetical protein